MVTGFHLEKTEFLDIGPFLFCAAVCCLAYRLVSVFMWDMSLFTKIWKTWKGDKFLLMLDAFDIPGIDEKGMSCTLPSIFQSFSMSLGCWRPITLAQYGHEHVSEDNHCFGQPCSKFCVTITWITAHIYRITCFFYIAVWPVYFRSFIIVSFLYCCNSRSLKKVWHPWFGYHRGPVCPWWQSNSYWLLRSHESDLIFRAPRDMMHGHDVNTNTYVHTWRAWNARITMT